jgi:hypothetical protein
MILKDTNLLRQFHERTKCEFCGRSGEHMEAHHFWFFRGIGGGSRLDHRYNLIALCRGWDEYGRYWSCHEAAQGGLIPRNMLLEIVARREGVTPEAIVAELERIRAADHHQCRPT